MINSKTLICVSAAIRNIQSELEGDLTKETKGDPNMHDLLRHGFSGQSCGRFLSGPRYEMTGLSSKKPDFVLLQPDRRKIFFELSLADTEPKNSFRANMRKQKVTKDIALLTHPEIHEHGRIFLFAIRWDAKKAMHPLAKRLEWENQCKDDCAAIPTLQLTDLDQLKNRKFLDRGFFFGSDFCFDFPISYAESLVNDLGAYSEIRQEDS